MCCCIWARVSAGVRPIPPEAAARAAARRRGLPHFLLENRRTKPPAGMLRYLWYCLGVSHQLSCTRLVWLWMAVHACWNSTKSSACICADESSQSAPRLEYTDLVLACVECHAHFLLVGCCARLPASVAHDRRVSIIIFFTKYAQMLTSSVAVFMSFPSPAAACGCGATGQHPCWHHHHIPNVSAARVSISAC
jgi:hypothetical protein